MRLFSRDGYGDTSLRDIAEAVGVSKSTLLHHYASKELLLSAVLAERDRGSGCARRCHAGTRRPTCCAGIAEGAA